MRFADKLSKESLIFTNLFTAPPYLTNSLLCNIRYLINDIKTCTLVYYICIPCSSHMFRCVSHHHQGEIIFFLLKTMCFFYTAMIYLPTNSGRRYKNPITDQDRPWGLQKVKAPIFQDSRHMKVVRLSALRTGRFYPTGNNLGNHFC